MGVRRCVAALLMIGLLVSCSEAEPEPSAEPSEPTSAVSSEPSPAESVEAEPALPSEAQADSIAGAKAFLRHYLETITHAMNTGDLGSLEKLADEACKTCKIVARRVSGIYSKGARVEGARWWPNAIFDGPGSTPGAPVLVVRVVQARQTLVDSSGRIVDRDARRIIPMEFHLERVTERWLISEILVLR